MKIDVEIVNPVERRIRMELPADVVDQEFLRVFESYGKRARIRGFRPGKAPRSVLKALYGDEVRGQVLSRLVERFLKEAVRERGLEVVSSPDVEAGNLEEGSAFAFSALVEVKPEIEIKNYVGLEVEKIKVSVAEDQVDRALRHLQESHAQLEPVEDRDIVERGDFVVVDFAGSMDGKPLAGGRAQNYGLEVGGGNALAQFEEALIGLKKDREHTISVAYPKDHFDQEFAGKAGDFRVVVREIKKKVLPPLDDEFAKDHGECGSLDELRQRIRARLESELREIQSRDLKEQILSRLIAAHPCEVPSAMVDRQTRYLMERHQRGPSGRGSGASGEIRSEEQMRKDLKPQALRQVREMLVLEKIAAVEKIEISDQELGERIEQLARAAGERGLALRALYRRDEAREDLRAQMVLDRTLDFLLERARVKEVERPVDASAKKG